jgi:TonB family protein
MPQNEAPAKEDKEALAKNETKDEGVAVDEVGEVTYITDEGRVYRRIVQDKKKTASGEDVFVVVEDSPQFPGGTQAMMQFLSENFRYPKEVVESAIQGRVICSFVIMKDGSISEVKVIRGIDPFMDAEAVRVIRAMPKWEPGKQRGQAVNVEFTLPIMFSLQKSEPVENAEFPGGKKAFMKYLADNVRYPVIAQENGIQGLVSAVFNIDSKGKVTFVKVTKSVDPSLDAEVKRVIENMPDWTLAKKSDEAIGMMIETHFVFRLQGDGVQPYNGPVPDDAVVVVAYGK